MTYLDSTSACVFVKNVTVVLVYKLHEQSQEPQYVNVDAEVAVKHDLSV